jgi:hypothetical protein
MNKQFFITPDNSQSHLYNEHSWLIYNDSYATPSSKFMLKKTFELVESMLARYSKVMMCRIDLHPSQFNPDNTMIESFLNRLRIALSEQYSCTVGYFCAREQTISKKEHYHLALLLSGHKVNYPDSILKQVGQRWEDETQGTRSFVDNSFYKLERGDKASIEPAIYRLSYFAKSRTKELNPPATSYLCAGILPKEQRYANVEFSYLLLVDAERAYQKSLGVEDVEAVEKDEEVKEEESQTDDAVDSGSGASIFYRYKDEIICRNQPFFDKGITAVTANAHMDISSRCQSASG